ncbi:MULTISPECIES: methyltransferase domain-containing protein [unclassified Streptomyces]|uniref:methyltransferase domain-containing protein n=1 Tax=unclassified Streptomyces TaxID=2593676 RepID=UPI00068EC038|nr:MULTISPECIES: methyltransferase domain-containing protein [unclassified Streptomyces]
MNADFAHYLDVMSTVEAVRNYKDRSHRLLGASPGDRVLDVGCGRGDDAETLAGAVGPTGVAVGVDIDPGVIPAATPGERSARLLRADATRLPFRAETFDACRADRVLVRTTDPWPLLAEMVRVCRRGGRILTVDPDYGTLVYDSADPRLTARIVDAYAGLVPGPHSARRMPALFQDAGLERVSVFADTLIVTDYDLAVAAFEIPMVLERAVASGALHAEERRTWLDDQRERAAAGRFFAAVTGFAVLGHLP